MNKDLENFFRVHKLPRRAALGMVGASLASWMANDLFVKWRLAASTQPSLPISAAVLEDPAVVQQLPKIGSAEVSFSVNRVSNLTPLTGVLGGDPLRRTSVLTIVTNEPFQQVHDKLPKIGVIYLNQNQHEQIELGQIEAGLPKNILPQVRFSLESQDKVVLSCQLLIRNSTQFQKFINFPSRLVMVYYDLQLGADQSRNLRQFRLKPVRTV